MKLILMFILLCGTAIANVSHYSFSIIQAKNFPQDGENWVNDEIAATQISDDEAADKNEGGFVDMDVSWFLIAGDTIRVRGLIRYNEWVDSLHAYVAAHPQGTITFDSATFVFTIGLNYITDTDSTTDSMLIGIARLKSGVGTDSRNFTEGKGAYYTTLFADSTWGVTWDSVCQRGLNAPTYWNSRKIAWSSPGAMGANDTVGGVLDSVWITARDTGEVGKKWTITIPGTAITAAFDSTGGLKDTTASRHPGFVVFAIRKVATLYPGLLCSFCTGAIWGQQNYCNAVTDIPTLITYYTVTWDGLESIGRGVSTIGRPVTKIGR